MNDLLVQENEQLKGLDESKAKQIKAVFEPMVKMLEGFESKYDEIVSLETSPEKCIQAKRLRIDISKIRIDADKVRKIQKEEYLRAGNAIQGVYNILKFAVTDKEDKLKDIELHYEKIEQAKIDVIREKREMELFKYNVDLSAINLGEMNESVWINYINGVYLNDKAIKEAERKAEADRIEQEKKEAAEREAINLENQRLRVEAAKASKKRIAEQKKLDKERKYQEQKLGIEREKAEAEKRIQDEIIKKERKAKEKLEKEIADSLAEEMRLEKEIADEKRKLAAASDKEKLTAIANYLAEQVETVSTIEAENIIKQVRDLVINFACKMK